MIAKIYLTKSENQRPSERYIELSEIDNDPSCLTLTPKDDFYELLEVDCDDTIYEHYNDDEGSCNELKYSKVEVYTDNMILILSKIPDPEVMKVMNERGN